MSNPELYLGTRYKALVNAGESNGGVTECDLPGSNHFSTCTLSSNQIKIFIYTSSGGGIGGTTDVMTLQLEDGRMISLKGTEKDGGIFMPERTFIDCKISNQLL